MNPEFLDFVYAYKVTSFLDYKKRVVRVVVKLFYLMGREETPYLWDSLSRKKSDVPTVDVLFENDGVGIKNLITRELKLSNSPNRPRVCFYLLTKNRINEFNCREFVASICHNIINNK